MIKKPMNSFFLNYLIECEKDIKENIQKWLHEFETNKDVVVDEISKSFNANVIAIMACLGEIGWCLPKFIERNIKVGNVLADLKNNVSINEIDLGIADCFTEREIEALTILTEKYLSDSESKKLNTAFKLYLKQEYFASAVLLAGLIDSASINQFLKTHNASKKVSQCWQCYGEIIQENFGGKYFSGEFPYKKNKNNIKREDEIIEFFKSINYGACFYDKKEILIPLSFSLLKFFNNSDWRNKKNGNIPSSINRHWLAHSMYDYDDITRADCIKLFCMLYQIIELYSML